ESDGFESGIDFMLNMSNIDNQVLSMLNPYKNIKVLNTLLYRKFQREAGITINNKLQTILFSANDKYIDGGFVEKKNAHNIHPKIPFKNHIWLPRENQIQALNDIIVLLKAHHIKLILVQAPVTRLLYKNFENRNEIDKFFLSKGNYYNFNNLLRLNDAVNFFDYSHLNQSGVQMFDRAFIMQCIQKREIKIDTLQCGKMR
ncbi:MAG: hypothetical protein JWR02_2852, partial [Mucilaginibacter sp.]|nr:hypothetical protein [Mucilaginibacter sp.]